MTVMEMVVTFVGLLVGYIAVWTILQYKQVKSADQERAVDRGEPGEDIKYLQADRDSNFGSDGKNENNGEE